MNILILSEHIEGKFGKYSGIDSVKLPDGTYMLPERVLSDADLEAAKDIIIEKRVSTSEILEYNDESYLEEGKVYKWNDPDITDIDAMPSDLFICRQSHLKTIYKPTEIPALFTYFRENADDLQWIQNELVETGWKRVYDGVQYECIQGHMTVEGQTPDITPALWKTVWNGEIEEWVQPLSTNPYMKGDQVTYNGFTWESIIDNNVWAPGVYGWIKI